MATQRAPAFLSYARENSDLALRITADLKAAGATVWLDQLAIRPGQQWDREVEQALDSCSAVVIILSPAAVQSDHVMDEVAYGLREGKTVIPVLLQQCRIPLQLVRLNRIDFTVDYDKGLKILCSALGFDGPPDLEEIARQFHEGTTRPLVVKGPLKFKQH